VPTDERNHHLGKALNVLRIHINAVVIREYNGDSSLKEWRSKFR
jgi:hypothetical protein